jgi:DNA-binding NtrC family response regulator
MTQATDRASDATVLVVDDEPYVRKVILRWLTEMGYLSAQAENADVALEYLREHDVQVVTLDISMPRRSGAELLPEIKRRWPDTEVVMLTALDETGLVTKMLAQGACGYLIKPVCSDDLVLQVRKAMDRRQSTIQQRQVAKELEEKDHERAGTIA